MSHSNARPRSDRPRPSGARAARNSRRPLPSLEALEIRSLMAVIAVSTVADTIDPSDDAISLREAIEVSNGTLPVLSLSAAEQLSVVGGLSAPAPNTIVFAIPGAGTKLISVNSPLPTITSPLAIDAITQNGASYNPSEEPDVFLADLTVRVDGHALAVAQPSLVANGISIAAPNSTLNGLIVTGFTGAAVSITGAGSQGNFLFSNVLGALPDPVNGRNFSGGPDLANGVGIYIASSNNRVGGNNPGLRNVVANNGVGVRIDTPGGTGNLVQGNFIIDNAAQGVYVSSSNNTIGEAITNGGNVISGNGAQGVLITGGPTVQGNNLIGNLIGSDMGVKAGARAKGLDPRPNLLQGVLILDSPKNTIGGTSATARNVLGGNNGDGLAVQGPNASGNRIIGNYVGFNIVNSLVSLFIPNQNGITIEAPGNDVGGAGSGEGNTISLNRAHGVLISGGLASGTSVLGNVIGLNPDGGSDFGNAFDGVHVVDAANTLIGGTTTGARNVISANNNGVVLTGVATTGSRVQGNYIGTGSNGVTDLGNAVNGVIIVDGPLNTIGGTASGQGNVISGNDRGVVITGATALNNSIQGNFIGTNLSGTAVINNEIDGVLITGGASYTAIGGTLPGAGNTIAFNAGNGVVINSGVGNAIRANSIHDNQQFGILLNASNNANNNQPYPTLNAAVPHGARVTLQGTLNALPLTTYVLEFFASAAVDPSGFGEGQRYLGPTTVTANAAGVATFSVDLASPVVSGEWISATATDPQGSTSSFAASIPAFPTELQFAAATYQVTESAGSIVVTVNRTGGFGGSVSIDYATAPGTATPGVEYAAVSGTLFFLPNDLLPKSFTIPILDTPAVGGSSTFTVNLSNATNGATVGVPASTTVTIVDDDLAGIKFATPTVPANEADGSVTVLVTRSSGVGSASVNFATANGTAIAGLNYTATSGTLHFAPGEVSKPIVVSLIRDNAVTGNLTFSVGLSSPVGAVLDAPATAVVAVTEADAVGALSFSTTSYVAQPGTTSATLTVRRTGGQGGTVSVAYATGGGTAVPGVDYVPLSGSLVFGPGETIKTINVPLYNPSNASSSTFLVTLSAPGGGATLGAIPTANVKVLRQATPVNPVGPTGDTTGPVVTGFTPVSGRGGVTSVVITFSESLDIGSAQDVVNYGTFASSFGRDNIPNTRDDSNVAITAATYNPATRQVTLRFASALSSSLRYTVSLNRLATSADGSGIMDASRNLLAGDGRTAGTPYVGSIGTTPTTTGRAISTPRVSVPSTRFTPTTTRGRTSFAIPSRISVRSATPLSGAPRAGSFSAWARRR